MGGLLVTLLALDMATRTGWALWTGASRYSGVQRFDLQRGESPGMRFLRFAAWLAKMLADNAPTVVYYEQTHHRGGAATSVAEGLLAVLLMKAAEAEVEICPVHSGTLKKFATGRGNASKAEMLAAARERWPEQNVADDDQADALWLLAYGMREVGIAEGGE